jgi:hypothetical protein
MINVSIQILHFVTGSYIYIYLYLYIYIYLFFIFQFRFFTASPDLGAEQQQPSVLSSSRKRRSFDALSFLASTDSLAFSPSAAKTSFSGPAHTAQHAYAAAVAEIATPAKFVEHLHAFQYGKPRLSRQELCAHVLRLSVAFERFARALPALRALPAGAREDLVARNAPLFVAYVLARYFAAATGQEQVQWLLQTAARNDGGEDVSGLHRKVMTPL